MSCASTKTEERNAQNEYTGFQHLGLTLRGSHSPPRRLRLESLECKQAPAERQLRPGWTVRGGAGGGAGPAWTAGRHPASGRPGSSDSGPSWRQPAHTLTLTDGAPWVGGWGQEGPAGAEGHFFFLHLSGSFFSVSRLFTEVYIFLLDTTYQSEI